MVIGVAARLRRLDRQSRSATDRGGTTESITLAFGGRLRGSGAGSWMRLGMVSLPPLTVRRGAFGVVARSYERCAGSALRFEPVCITGECEVLRGKLSGIALHIGARVAARAGPGEILVSSTVKDLVPGAGLHFDDKGVHSLTGPCRGSGGYGWYRSRIHKRSFLDENDLGMKGAGPRANTPLVEEGGRSSH
jgi:hypothetical protein